MAKQPSKQQEKPDEAKEICGVVMPISQMGEYDSAHWVSVRDILHRAIDAADMLPQPVWEGLDSDIIHGRIVLNLYSNPVVVCDVSGLNPNVMFELGMRLTFQKPTIIVTDDASSLPFDTRSIEHLIYPRGLGFHAIEQFIEKLTERISAVRQRAMDGTYTSFIDTFGPFEIAEPTTKEVPIDRFVLDRLDQLSATVQRVERTLRSSSPPLAAVNALMGTDVMATHFAYAILAPDNATVEGVVDLIRGMGAVASVKYQAGLLGGDLIIRMDRPVNRLGFDGRVKEMVQGAYPAVSLALSEAR